MLNRFFDKYIMTSTLKYTHNNFYLMNIPFFIMPVDILISLSSKKDISHHKELYTLFKESTKKNFMPKFNGMGIGDKKELDFLKYFFTASGFGLVEIIDFDEESKRAIVVLNNSPFAAELKGKVDFAVDTLLRGVFAGIFSAILKEDVDCVEVECTALNDNVCKFIVKPKKEFDLEKNIVREQLVFDD
jgi:predicted hydrocarbon binding protein